MEAINLYKLNALAKELGWEDGDEIILKIAGTRTSGIHQTEGANPKWAPPYGTVTHNRDAQIVIENVTRREQSKCNPMADLELQQHFHIGSGGQLYKTRELEVLQGPGPMATPWYTGGLELIKWITNSLSN